MTYLNIQYILYTFAIHLHLYAIHTTLLHAFPHFSSFENFTNSRQISYNLIYTIKT